MKQQKKFASLEKSDKKNSRSNLEEKVIIKQHNFPSPEKTNVIKLGICAVRKKVQSKPMKEILKRISCSQIQIVQMWQCLDNEIKTWPKVDALICFSSQGFPYLKAWKYVKRNKPFLINSLEKQEYLWDRTVVYDILKKIKIPVAKHYMIFRDMNYLDEIQKKAFGQQVFSPQLEKSEIYSQQFKTQPLVHPEKNIQNQSKSPQRISSNSPDFLETRKKYSLNSVQNLRQSLKKIQCQDDDDEKDSSKVSAAKRSFSREINNESAPNTLRKFHENRINKIQKYQVEQVDDFLMIKGEKGISKLNKPFVQKPFDGDNHQIAIYYPQSMGGGRKMLFRKIKNSSSKFQQEQNNIRRDGNYIYEQFLPANAFDIKVYTIGAYYMYAEARKSPTLDGIVERDSMGKQKRFPIILTPEEKFIAKKITQQFEQEVCGFDLLRANGKSYVCDVNGWSFVKGNPKYWNDCAILLKRKIFHKFLPSLMKEENRIYQRFKIDRQNGYRPPIFNLLHKKQELRSIVSIFRHGDRSPKLKLKLKIKESQFLDFFKELRQQEQQNQIKLKDAKKLTKLLQITRTVLQTSVTLKQQEKVLLTQMKIVLQSGGHFQGLNRKCQFRVLNRNEEKQISELLIIVKWGGELSLKGFNDAVQLGKRMRMEKYNDDHDFLSLHSSYRHDLKTYSSDQGRCLKTAGSFLKGFLNIEGGMAPIITNLVKSDKKAQNLLDCTSQQNHSNLSYHIVQKLSNILNSNQPLMTSYLKGVQIEDVSPEMIRIIKQIDVPNQKLQYIQKQIEYLVSTLEQIETQSYQTERNSRHSYASSESEQKEDVFLVLKRWRKLREDFYSHQEKKYTISKIPDIYDTIRHDVGKNSYIFSDIKFDIDGFMRIAKLLAFFVVPNQYGINQTQKLQTAQQIASPLLEKINVDLNFWRDRNYEQQYWKYRNDQAQSWKHIRTRLYFTSASHIYSVIHLLTLGNNHFLLQKTPDKEKQKILKSVYMSYLSHIEFRLYENFTCNENDPKRFRVQLSISPDYTRGQNIHEFSFGHEGFTIDEIHKFLNTVVKKQNKQIVHKQNDNLLKKMNSVS